MEKIIAVLFLFTVFIRSCTGEDELEVANETYAREYLKWKGYMSEGVDLNDALARYQEFMGMNATGEMDDETMTMMTQPQCGVPDIFPDEPGFHQRRKRYALHGTYWPRTRLTFRISSLPNSIRDKRQAFNELHKAFKAWESQSNLRFFHRAGKGRVDMEVSFVVRSHSDPGRPTPFDGRGKVLAHAFFPRVGQIHFDNDEIWSLDKSGTNLFLVAVHEIGHALGLRHSIRDSIMFSAYQSRISLTNPLFQDDITGIRLLYGPYSRSRLEDNTTTAEEEGPLDRNRPLPTKVPPPDLCQNPEIDAITTTEDGTVYVFKGIYYWVLTPSGLKEGYPQQIFTGWRGLPDNVDAAVTTPDGFTHFFV